VADLANPDWFAAYRHAQGDPTAHVRRVATAGVRASERAIQDYVAAATRSTTRVHEEAVRPLRTAQPARTMAEALTAKQRLIAATALPRVSVDLLDPAINAPGPFFLKRTVGDFSTVNAAPVADAIETMERPSRMMHSKTAEVLEQMDRHDRMMERAFGSVAPVEPVPGLDGSLIHPLPSIRPEPPRDEIIAEIQERTTDWLETACPKVITSLSAAHDALLRGDEESMSHGASSCRRALVALADAVEPPRPGMRLDHTGQPRKVDRDSYKNRLLLFVGMRMTSASARKMSEREYELLVHRLEALVNRLGKGVHDDHTYAEAAHIYFTTWAVISEIVHVAES
jgi:hypothetical protein